MSEKNPFDFSDLSDLPVELAKKLRTDTSENARKYADIVIKGAEAGYAELEINQIIAAAMRMGIDVLTQNTVRAYLNAAVEQGMISKPTRMTYGPATAAKAAPAKAEKAESAGLSDAVATAADSDPLADL